MDYLNDLLDKPVQQELFPFPERPFAKLLTSRNDVAKGDAGETLTLAFLKCLGVNVWPSNQGERFDLLAEVHRGGSRYVKIQVKSLTSTKENLTFSFTRGFHGSKKGMFDYVDTDFDISACVSLAERRVLFSAGYEKSISWKRHQFRAEGSEFLSWQAAIDAIFLRKINTNPAC